MTTLQVRIERFPIAGTFTISRGSKTEAVVVVAEIRDAGHVGRGECVPYPRYGETPQGVADLLRGLAAEVSGGLDRAALQCRLPAGAARNALDCAFWDIEAKRSGVPAFRQAGLTALNPLLTAFTLSLDTPEAMARAAQASGQPLLKLKLGAQGDPERLVAIRSAVPDTRLIVDANEGWTPANLVENFAACHAAGVELIEQPLPANADAALAEMKRPVPVCADESVHARGSLAGLRGRYDAVNIKLDKTGGLTEALAMAEEARASGFSLMVGCMLASSLAMAPALIVAQGAEIVDLDGPLLLASDRADALRYDRATVFPPSPALWG